jgi:hypothetical protein
LWYYGFQFGEFNLKADFLRSGFMAKIDTSVIDARIDKLRKLRELADDPEAAELLAEMFGGNASTLNGSTPSTSSHKQPRTKRAYTKRASKPKKGKRRKKPSDAVLKVMSTGMAMSTHEIADKMKANGFKFTGRYKDNEVVAVNDFIRALKRQHKIKAIGNKNGNARVKLWMLAAPSAQETFRLVPTESTPNKLLNFLRSNGPATRVEIIQGTGLPSGSYSYYFKGKGNKGQFRQREDGKWEVAA